MKKIYCAQHIADEASRGRAGIMSAAVVEHVGDIAHGATAPFGIRFGAFLGGALVYAALATMNAWPNLDAALQGDRAAADAEEKARAERAAKRAAAKTRETGDPETVKTWLDSKRVVHSPGHVLPLPAAYVDYEADCRTHGETSVARCRRFAEELRKLGLDVRERGNRKRFEVQGLALSSQASGSGLRLAYSR